MSRLLAVRLDNVGDVVLTGPAVRAMARDGSVTMLAGSVGAAAARLLPGVDETLVFDAPWISGTAVVDAALHMDLIGALASRRFDEAIIFTSSHQSCLPMALLCRLAGIRRVAGISHDFPGTLLDDVVRGDPDVHEVLRNLQLVEAVGHTLAAGEVPSLQLQRTALAAPTHALPARYVVVHPGASVPARTLGPSRWSTVVDALLRSGVRVVLTGGRREQRRPRAPEHAIDLRGRTELPELIEVLRRADAVVVGNTGPMHLAAATGTPVVAVFAPTVPLDRWRPWGVRHTVLGDQDVDCAGCRSRKCPMRVQHCLASITPAVVVDAVRQVTSDSPTPRARTVA